MDGTLSITWVLNTVVLNIARLIKHQPFYQKWKFDQPSYAIQLKMGPDPTRPELTFDPQ